jgi:hypothetical protein
MKIWEYNTEAKKIQEGKISLAGKTVLILPGIETTDNNPLFIGSYIKIANNLIENNNGIKIYCASWTPDPNSETGLKKQKLSPVRIDEVIKHNKAPYAHVNAMQGVVDEVFLPILKDKSRWKEFDNLTVFANSYGTIALTQLENGLRKAMAGLNYSREDQKKIMNKVCGIEVLPVTNIEKDDISFKKIFLAPSNDRMNAGVNLNADHLSGNIDSKPHYEKIGEHGLLISAPVVPVKNVDGNLVGLPFPGSPININSGHNIISLLTQGDDIYTSPKPDLFPALIRTTLNNAVSRESGLQNLTGLLKPARGSSRFCERIQNELLREFVDKGEIKPGKKNDILVVQKEKPIILSEEPLILRVGMAGKNTDKKGLSL